MNDEIKQYLQKGKAQELIKRGLFERKVYNTNEVTEEMKKNLEYSVDEGYYSTIPYDVSDEEYKQILKISSPGIQSGLPNVFFFGGILIFLLGALGGLVALFSNTSIGGFNFLATLTVWIGAFFMGMVLIGFGKIIELLVQIHNKA